MKTVAGVELYHIRNLKYGEFKLGDKLDFGDSNNEYFDVYNKSPEYPLYDDVGYLKSVATYYWKYLRETTFEETRKEQYPDHPSRQTSLFLTDENHLENWLLTLEYSNLKVYKFKLNGKLHQCDATLVDIHPHNRTVVKEFAERYYSGEILPNSNKVEYLFEGTAEVIKIVK